MNSFRNVTVFWYSQSWVIKLCYQPYKIKDSCPLNTKRPWSDIQYLQLL